MIYSGRQLTCTYGNSMGQDMSLPRPSIAMCLRCYSTSTSYNQSMQACDTV